MSNKPNTDTLDRIANRRSMPKPTIPFKDKSKYNRKKKHKGSGE